MSDSNDSGRASPATWAVVLGLVSASAGCFSTGGDCSPEPGAAPFCQGKFCDSVEVVELPDGGLAEFEPDAGTNDQLPRKMLSCGCCNG